jgi:hypothetical protein
MVFVPQYIPCSCTFSAVEGNGDVKADPVHPGGEPTAFIEGSKRLPKLDDNFLGKIFSVAPVPAIRVVDLIKDLLVLIHQGVKPLVGRIRSAVAGREPLSSKKSEGKLEILVRETHQEAYPVE